MGSTKIKTVDMSIQPDEDKKKTKSKSHSGDLNETQADRISSDESVPESSESRYIRHPRSKTYIAARAKVDRTKTYPLTKAVDLLLKTSYSKFTSTITADATVKDSKLNLETTFPHSTGRQIKVAIASEKLLKDIEKGNIDFDILITKPDLMPQIAKHARILGPKGLMPNPKNKTITDKPDERKKELEKGVVQIKTEKKHPLIHVVVGKTDQLSKEIIANTTHLINAIGPKRLTKLTLSATMSPGIKVDLSEFQTT